METSRQIILKLFQKYIYNDQDYNITDNIIGPEPIILSQTSFSKMQEIANAINSFVPAYIMAWHQDSNLGKQLRNIIKLPKKFEQLLLSHYQTNPQNLIKSSQRSGSYRPDLVIIANNQLQNEIQKHYLDNVEFRVCEINARFSLNGYFLSSALNEALRILSCTPGTFAYEKMATSIPHIHSFVKDLKNRFGLQNDNKIFIAIEQELLKNDIVLLKSILNQYEIQFIFPSDIYAIQNEGNVQLFDKKTNNQIQKIILELHQTEIMSLDQNVLIGLLQLSDQGLCLNDLRAILILHDKRLLTVLSGFYSCQLLEEIMQFSSNKEQIQQNINTLLESVIKSIPLEQAIDQYNKKYSKSWFHSQEQLIFKPSLGGKGIGIIKSNDFNSINEFLQSLQDNQNKDSSYFSTGIVQPFLKSIQFQAPIYNENKEWQFENCNIVSTLLCMDGIFYGPGIFRCSQSDIIALSKGGFCQPAALLLTQVPSKARFILTTRLLDDSENNYKEEKEVLGSQINAAFDEHSAVLTTILSEKQGEEDENWNSDRLKQYVCEIIKGKPQDHLDFLLKNEQDQSLKQQQELQMEQRAFATFISEQEKNQQILKNKPKIVWDIKPQSLTTKSNDGSSNNTYARSHGTGRFDTHTDGSWYEKPPRALALSVLNCDRRGGGFFSIVKVSECIKQLSEDEQLEFKQKKYLYKVPPEFSGGQNSQYKILPVQFDQDKIRFRYDLMQPLRDEKQCPLLEKFKNISKKLIKQKMCLIPEKYCIIADNQRILHARTLIKDERRFLQRIRFFL